MDVLMYVVVMIVNVFLLSAEASDRHAQSMTEWLIQSLRVHRRQACDGEKVALRCPQYTHIHMEKTFYGRVVPSSQLCPVPVGRREEGTWEDNYEDTSCDVTNAHTRVLEKCQERRKCRVPARPQFFGRDPCPTTSKYLHISFKCKPSQFTSEFFCEGQTMQLSCKPKRRLAVFSAIYGRTEQPNKQGPEGVCGASPGPIEDCTVDVLGAVASKCHAHQSCSLSVNDSQFANPCPPHVLKYLNLIYMCVSEDVFSEDAIKGELPLPEGVAILPDLLASVHNSQPQPNYAIQSSTKPKKTALNNDAAYAPVLDVNSAYPPATTSVPPFTRQISPTCLPGNMPNALGFVHNWIATWNYVTAHKETFLLYFFLSAACGVILLLVCCIVEQCSKRLFRRTSTPTGEPHPETYPLNGNNMALFPEMRGAKCEEYGSYSPSGVDTADSRLDMNGVSFMRFNHPAPPRPQYYS